VNHLKDGASSWVNDAQGLVLAHSTDDTAILVPADTVDKVWVDVAKLVHQLPRAHVPHTNHIIAALRGRTDNIQRSQQETLKDKPLLLWSETQVVLGRDTEREHFMNQ